MNKTFLLFLMLFLLAIPAASQDKISGTLQCPKPDPRYAIDIGDRPNHSFVISQSKCTWSKPMEIAGDQVKDSTNTGSYEMTGNTFRRNGYAVGTTASGDKTYVHSLSSGTLKDGVPQGAAKGTWSFIGGTGKLKGLKGKGTTTAKVAPDGSATVEIEGEYTLPK